MAAKDANKWLITLSVMVPTLLEILDTSIANVALGHIQGSLSAGQDEVTWVLTSYLVSNAVVIPMSGWLSRVMGRRTYLMASVAMFVLSSMLCGLAGSLGSLVFFRVVQGIGGGGLQPMSQAILLETFPPAQRGLAMAIFAMGAVLGPILGPLIGGYITDHYSWRWIFFINVPIGALALFMIWSFVQDPPYLERMTRGERIDYPGLILLTLGLGCLQIVLDKGQQEDWMESTYILVLTVVSGVSLLSLLFWELRTRTPVVDLRAFKDRSFATGNAVMFFGFFAFFGSIVMLPLFLQNLMGYTAFLAGVVLGPGGLIMLLLLPLVGKLTQKVDPRLLLSAGMAVSAYSLFDMAGFSLQVDMGTAIMARNIQAIGISCFFVPLSFLTMAYVPREKMNNASAIFNLLRNLGGSCGVAFVSTLLARRTQFHQARLSEALSLGDPRLNLAVSQVKSYLATQAGQLGDLTDAARAAVYQFLQRETALRAFTDVFHAQAMMFVALIALAWLIRRPRHGTEAAPGAH
jgi:DHA2 family multidrug resistance protein